MKKLFKWLLLLTAVLAVGVTVLLYNPGLVKGPLERYLSNLAGYRISLEGELDIDPGRTTGFTATNIQISGPGWASHQDLIALGHLSLSLDVSSLFDDIVVIDSLQVENLQLNLETDTEGKGNWISANAPPSKDAKSDESGGDPAIIFNNIQIKGAGLHYRNGENGTEHILHIASLNQHQGPDGMLQIVLDGALNDRRVEIDATIGPYKNLLGGHDITYSGRGHFGTLDFNSSGLIDNLLKPGRPRFNLEMQGPNIDEITSMLGVDDLGSGHFSLRASGEEVNDQYEAGITGEIGDVTLNVSAKASDLSQLSELDLSLSVNGPRLGAFTRAFGIKHWPDKPFQLKGEIERVGGTLNISDLTLGIGSSELVLDALLTNFPSLDASRITLSVSGDDVSQFRQLLGVSGVATGPFEIHGKLDISPQEVELLQVEVQTSLGRATLSGTLGAAPSYVGSKLHLHLAGNNAHTIMSIFNIDALPETPFRLDTRIETVENGMLIERGVLVTMEDEQLELGGFLAFSPGSKGTDVEVMFSGQHLNRVLQRIMGETRVPDQPYYLSGRVQIVEEGVRLDKVKAELKDIKLLTTGLVSLDDQFLGTGFDFQLNGDDLSALGDFAIVGDSLDIFVPGQPYQAAGHFAIENSGWHLKGVSGRIGKTALDLNLLISNQPEWAGSDVRFSIEGPELYELITDLDESDLPHGAFSARGQVGLSADTLSINDLNFKTARALGKIDLELGWPIDNELDANFNVNIEGADIRHLLPRTDAFEAEMASFKIAAIGQKKGALISLKHFDASIGDLQVSLKGKLDEDPTDENVDISFSATSEDISTLGRLNGERLPAMALDLKADFKGNAHQFVLQNLNGTLGQNHIAGLLDVALDGPKPNIRLTARSDYLDIRPFLNQPKPEKTGKFPNNNKHLIPATPLPLDALATADISVKLNVAELRFRKDSLENLVLEADIQDGSLAVSQFSAEGSHGKLRATLSIVPTVNSKAAVMIDLNTEKLILNLSGQPEDKLLQAPAFDLSLHANGKGGTLREVAGSINGSVYLGSEGGTLEGVDLSILDTFILEEIYSLIMPKTDTKDDLDLSCAAAILKITDGLVETDPALAFTTSRITLISKGSLDLKTEKMHFNFNAIPNNAFKISAGELFNPYILVSGTLSKPEVGLDPAKILLHGGAAIGTAGISILAKGLIDRVGNTAPLCEEMLEQVHQNHQSPR